MERERRDCEKHGEARERVRERERTEAARGEGEGKCQEETFWKEEESNASF
jgi:hypothetical protein